ncbi:hypothetical protein DUNSADRAFT_7447 [Dunaliella salina]|uniref:Uncharacterized protein n=1 Tax=Dunaliella salina TaxID=3046 RepID=A0ABQ7GLC2_DUNSA|nr:hypothetical protein DUNSADRAFT_7447 [Dunaliella salina]|eukprot:KAF5835413.1 hypothetical protein DUNSADRAFT_7447 [Dunaliella salina]
MPRIRRAPMLENLPQEARVCEPEQQQGSLSSHFDQHHSVDWQDRVARGLGEGLNLCLRAIQQNVPHAVLPWQGSRPQVFMENSSRSAFKHELQRDGGLVLGNGDKDRLKALLGLAVINLAALGGSAQSLLSPQGPGGCDHNQYERCANCVTSAPFVMVGVHAFRKRSTLDGKIWGASMMGVGMCSCGFHASTGKWRTLGRRLDYWSIAMSSNLMLQAVHGHLFTPYACAFEHCRSIAMSSNLMLRAIIPNVPVGMTVASMALTPFKPFLVSFLNSTAMEYKFLERCACQTW